MKKSPWQQLPKVWPTESKYWSWVRGQLRKSWSRHPIKVEFIKSVRVKIDNPNPRGRVKKVWGIQCVRCKEHHITNNVDIDHKDPAGSLLSVKDFLSFCTKLFFVSFDDLQPLCKPCHKIVTHSQRKGISEEEAESEKKAIQFIKDTTPAQQKDFLIRAGYNEADVSNAKKRRSLLEDHFMRNE